MLGLSWETDAARPAPAAALSAYAAGPVEDLYRSWVGRWVLVGRNEVHLDPAGTLGVLYLDPSVAPRRGSSVSSSPAILARQLGPGARAAFEIRHARGMDWYPAPRTRLPGIRRLLPTQILRIDRLAAGEACVRPRNLRAAPAADDPDQLVDGLQAYLVDALRAMAQGRDRLYLPLTAGHDSRTLLAAGHAADVPLETYTFVVTPRLHGHASSRADLETPPRLAATVGRPHRLIHGRRQDATRIDAWRSHTAGHSVGVDERMIAVGQWDTLPAGALVLRGGVFELGRGYYYRQLPDLRSAGDPMAATTIAESFALGRHYSTTLHHIAALEEWLAWCRAHPMAGLDIRDRLYLDQRLGAWLSAQEQGLDLTVADRVHVANSYRYFIPLLSLPEPLRSGGHHQRQLVARMAPPLAAFPINSPDSLARKAANYLLKRLAGRGRMQSPMR